MKFLSLSVLSVSALSAVVSAGPLAAIDQLRVFRSSEPELRLIQYGYVMQSFSRNLEIP